MFSVGGNAGFALGPVITTPVVLVFGLSGTLALVVFPLAAALLTVRELARLRRLETAPSAARVAEGADDWGAFSRLGGLIGVRHRQARVRELRSVTPSGGRPAACSSTSQNACTCGPSSSVVAVHDARSSNWWARGGPEMSP